MKIGTGRGYVDEAILTECSNTSLIAAITVAPVVDHL